MESAPPSERAETPIMAPPPPPSLEALGERLYNILLDVLVDTSKARKITGMILDVGGTAVAGLLTNEGRPRLLERVAEAEAALRAAEREARETMRDAREAEARVAASQSARDTGTLYVPPHRRGVSVGDPVAPGDGLTAEQRAHRPPDRRYDDRARTPGRSRGGSEAGSSAGASDAE